MKRDYIFGAGMGAFIIGTICAILGGWEIAVGMFIGTAVSMVICGFIEIVDPEPDDGDDDSYYWETR